MSDPPGSPEPSIRPLAESGLLVELGETVDPALVARVAALTAALVAARLPGVVDLVPAYATIMIVLDPVRADADAIATEVRRLAAGTAGAATFSSRRVEIPVAYGGAHGPDLSHVADHTGLAPDAVIARHAAETYTVACMGFAPGFGFLVGLPPVLHTPRRPDPRTRVPAGSVGIGAAQTGVYSLETPGGWNLIGRTPRRVFDLHRAEPALLQPGDRVVFRPISVDEYAAIEAAERSVEEPATPRDDASQRPAEGPVATPMGETGR